MKVIQFSPLGPAFVPAMVLSLLARRKEYDCIYSRDLLLVLFAAPMRIFGKPIIFEMNGILSLSTEMHRRTQRVRFPQFTPLICSIIRLMEFFAIRYSDLVLPVTEKMRRTLLRECKADSRKLIVVPNSVDTTVFKPLANGRNIRRELGLGKETTVMYLGTFLARWKGSEKLFQAAGNIQRRRTDIAFLIVGSGPLLEEVKRTTVGCQAFNQMLFVGALNHEVVPSYFSAADVYVYDTIDVQNRLVEKQGLCPTKILEAMACGKPVIAPKEPELEAMLRKSNGGFSASSIDEVQALIEKFADSAALARSMGRNARRYVELNHDLTRLTGLVIELISEVVSSRRS